MAGAGEVYTSEKFGSDETGDGSESKPYKTVLHALKAKATPGPKIWSTLTYMEN